MEWLDYATLRFIWWALVAVLLIGFAVMDGFDLGVATLLPFVARDDVERRILINAIGPVWDGNQVWLILGAGAVFAAFPSVYAAAFSGMYTGILIVLFALFLRPVGFDYRSKLASPAWRGFWDWALFVSGIAPALLFGLVIGNLFSGIAFSFDAEMRAQLAGGLLDLLHPFAWLAAGVSLSMLTMQGASYLAIRTEGAIRVRALAASRIFAVATVALFALGGWLVSGMPGHRVAGGLDPAGASNPLGKQVVVEAGAWLANFQAHPALWIVPLLAMLAALAVLFVRRDGVRFVASSLAVAGIILTAGIALFPFLLPSSLNPDHGLTIWDASASRQTLGLMLIAAGVFVPLILGYTAWVFRVLSGRITPGTILENEHSAY